MCPQNSLSLVISEKANHDMEQVKRNLLEERLAQLVAELADTVMDELRRLVAEATEASQVEFSQSSAEVLMKEVVRLGESEPYGVRGGVVVITFTNWEGQTRRLGRIRLDEDTIETYELEVEVFESKEAAVRLGNALRRVWGQAKVTTMDTKFQLTKRKLYGSKAVKNSEERAMYCQRKPSIWNSPDKSENLVLKTLALSYT